MAKFSVILPVKNGGKYVESCIRSVVEQSFSDFELIILENFSADNTQEIISSFKDSRIKVFPAHKPLSMEENWHRAIHVPKHDYVTLIGHDDLLDKNYLEVMSGLIDRHRDASLFQTHFRYIDAEGDVIGKCSPMISDYEPSEVIKGFLSNKIDLIGTGFMMRSSDYDSIGGIPSYPGLLFADMQLFMALGSKSYMAVASEECFSYRRHQQSTTHTSSGGNLLKSFGLLVNYLATFKDSDSAKRKAIDECSVEFLMRYCQAISHKVLRTPLADRNGLMVEDIVEEFRKYGKTLTNSDFEPLNYRLIRAGQIIDNSRILRNLYLKFRRFLPNSILK